MTAKPSPLSIAVFVEGAFIHRVITSAPVQVASLDLDIEGTTRQDLSRVPAGLDYAGKEAILSVDQGQNNPDYCRSLFLSMPQDDDLAPDPTAPQARRILLTMHKGEVESCLADGQVRVLILNRDVEGFDETDLRRFPHEDMLFRGSFDSEANWMTPTVDAPALSAAWVALPGVEEPTSAPRRSLRR